jgi:hypothetical protein
MSSWDAAGYMASCLVVIAFCMKDILILRVVAIASNCAFLAYGLGLGLAPVWALHAILLPINCWRLWQGTGARWPRSRPARADVPG